MARVCFYVQSLLGIGHLVRAYRLARALAEGGFDVDLVSGGVPVDGLDPGRAHLRQLPPVKAGPSGFADLVKLDGSPFTERDRAARRDEILDMFDETRPDILVIEAFPFGRRQMRFELVPLLERAHARADRPLIAASVRDILQESRKPGRAEESSDLILRYFDLVLVHGDAALIRLERTFPLASAFTERIVYTGLVGPEASLVRPSDQHDVIVSAGGGAVGENLLRAALAARPMTALADARWLLVTGPNLAERTYGDLKRQAPPNVTVARFVADLPARFREARLSISQAGYNSVADLLAAGCRPVLVPFAMAGETEQSERAGLLEARGLAIHLTEAELDPVTLADAIARALAMPAKRAPIALDGAARTVALLRERLSAPAHGAVPAAHGSR